jgi:hypothetical protein
MINDNDKVMKNIEDVEVLLEGLDVNNITSILDKCRDIMSLRKKLDELEDMLKTKIKIYLKERDWDRYVDTNNKISVSLVVQKREDFDKQQLKLMLTDAQYSQVIKTTTFEKLIIVTQEARDNLKKYVSQKKK